jgi:hypothetical protein
MDIHEEGVIRAEHELAFEFDLAVLKHTLKMGGNGHGGDCTAKTIDKLEQAFYTVGIQVPGSIPQKEIHMNRTLNFQLMPFLRGTALKRGAIFGSILVAALAAFEVFNFSTTQFALQDMLGDVTFAGMRWATILALAFCGMDFAGIARIFTPEQGRDEPAEVWYLFGAWLLAAAFNAGLTWWGVSVAIVSHQSEGASLLSPGVMARGVPVFVAAMVWLIRVLIIGTFSVAGERLFTVAEAHTSYRSSYRPYMQREEPKPQPRPATNPIPSYAKPAPRPFPTPAASLRTPASAEPTYHPVGMTASGREENASVRR